MKAECSSDVLRLLFTWSDRTLAQDWQSALRPVPPAGDPEALKELVFRYIELRRRAYNWSPRRYDRNNHRFVDHDAVVALLLDANRVDQAASPQKKARRTGRPRVRCVVCRTRFAAERSTARYCSETCKQRARRGRRSAEQGTSGQDPRDTLSPTNAPSQGADPNGAA